MMNKFDQLSDFRLSNLDKVVGGTAEQAATAKTAAYTARKERLAALPETTNPTSVTARTNALDAFGTRFGIPAPAPTV